MCLCSQPLVGISISHAASSCHFVFRHWHWAGELILLADLELASPGLFYTRGVLCCKCGKGDPFLMAEETNQGMQIESALQYLLSAFPKKSNPSPLQMSHVGAVPEVSPTYQRKAGSVDFVTYTSDSVTGEKSAFIAWFSLVWRLDFLPVVFTKHIFSVCWVSPASKHKLKCVSQNLLSLLLRKKWEGDTFVLAYNKMSIFFLKKWKSNLFSSQPSFLKIKSILLP